MEKNVYTSSLVVPQFLGTSLGGGDRLGSCLTQRSLIRMRLFTPSSVSSLRGVMKNVLLNRMALECFLLPSFCHFVHSSTRLPPSPALNKTLNTTLTWNICTDLRPMDDGTQCGGRYAEVKGGDPKEKRTLHRRLLPFIRQGFDLPVRRASAGVCH